MFCGSYCKLTDTVFTPEIGVCFFLLYLLPSFVLRSESFCLISNHLHYYLIHRSHHLNQDKACPNLFFSYLHPKGSCVFRILRRGNCIPLYTIGKGGLEILCL